jgi:hypothetical protein
MNKLTKTFIISLLLTCITVAGYAQKLLPDGWDAKTEADKVLAGLINVCNPKVKGAHDSDLIVMNGKAYIAYMANDRQPGENPAWDFVYVAMSIVDPVSGKIERVIPLAAGGQKFANHTLRKGAIFVPRMIIKDPQTLRCFFAVEQPGKFEAQTWALDFDIKSQKVSDKLFKAKLKTSAGIEDMQPVAFYKDAVKFGFKGARKDYGLYPFDIKQFNGRYYSALNNFPGGQNALSILHEDLLTFEILGHFNEPASIALTEAAINRLPDGRWLAICRQGGGTGNYAFTECKDGKTWTAAEFRDLVKNGTTSKPVFEKFGGIYYLGWQQKQAKGRVSRSVFNIDVSNDGKNWERKYHFDTEKSFQYPALFEYNGTIYLSVTQGDHSGSRKERIMFGTLEQKK